VHATDPNGLLVITQLQPIAVLFSLPQDELPQVVAKLRAGVQLSAEAYDRDDTQKIATGKLLTIDNQIDTTTGTYKLKSVFDNRDNALFPNQFVNMHLLVDTKHDLTIIPAPAIQRGPQGTYVYAVGSDNTVKIRPVTIAQTTGNNVGLSSGLNTGDVVVIDGQDKLQDGSKVTPTFSANPAGARGAPAQAVGQNAAPAIPSAPASSKPSRSQAGGSRR
jgi:multidrug efflux system membrane fusion protein